MTDAVLAFDVAGSNDFFESFDNFNKIAQQFCQNNPSAKSNLKKKVQKVVIDFNEKSKCTTDEPLNIKFANGELTLTQGTCEYNSEAQLAKWLKNQI